MEEEMKIVQINNVRVYSSRPTAGPPDGRWWDLSGIYNEAGKLGFKPKFDLKKLNVKLNSVVISQLGDGKPETYAVEELHFFGDFRMINLDATVFRREDVEEGGGNITRLTDLMTYKTSNHSKSGLKSLECNERGCSQYQVEIHDLLLNRKDIDIHSEMLLDDVLRKWNWPMNTARIKAECVEWAARSKPRIRVRLPKVHYQNSGNLTCEDHNTILSGILFEAGNIYCGNWKVSDETSRLETCVTVDNCRRVLRIVGAGHPISQNDWRNLMALVIGMGVDLTTFEVTARALRYFGGTGHDSGIQAMSQDSSGMYAQKKVSAPRATNQRPAPKPSPQETKRPDPPKFFKKKVPMRPSVSKRDSVSSSFEEKLPPPEAKKKDPAGFLGKKVTMRPKASVSKIDREFDYKRALSKLHLKKAETHLPTLKEWKKRSGVDFHFRDRSSIVKIDGALQAYWYAVYTKDIERRRKALHDLYIEIDHYKYYQIEEKLGRRQKAPSSRLSAVEWLEEMVWIERKLISLLRS